MAIRRPGPNSDARTLTASRARNGSRLGRRQSSWTGKTRRRSDLGAPLRIESGRAKDRRLRQSEQPRTKIQAIGRQQQRYGETCAAERSEDLQRFGFNIRSAGEAGKSLDQCSHLRPPISSPAEDHGDESLRAVFLASRKWLRECFAGNRNWKKQKPYLYQ